MEPPAEPPIPLEQQLCFALHDASRAMTGCYRPLLEELGLSYSQYAVMLVLWEQDSVTLSLLCSRLHLDSGTLSPLVTRLQTRGLVDRRRRTEDERTVQISLTAAGRALRDRAAGVQAGIESATGLDRAELATLRDDLRALADRLRAARSAAS
jgi:DNA-binding MarR family transcriptional regulator